MFANGIFHKKWNKSDKIDLTPLYLTNGLIHIPVEESTSIQWVNANKHWSFRSSVARICAIPAFISEYLGKLLNYIFAKSAGQTLICKLLTFSFLFLEWQLYDIQTVFIVGWFSFQNRIFPAIRRGFCPYRMTSNN